MKSTSKQQIIEMQAKMDEIARLEQAIKDVFGLLHHAIEQRDELAAELGAVKDDFQRISALLRYSDGVKQQLREENEALRLEKDNIMESAKTLKQTHGRSAQSLRGRIQELEARLYRIQEAREDAFGRSEPYC